MEPLGRSATFADVKRIGFLTNQPAGGLAVSASYTEAALRAGRTSLGVRLSDWITRRTVSNSLMAHMIFAANDQSSETTNGRLRLALEQLHGQQLSDFENEDTDSLEEPDELVDWGSFMVFTPSSNTAIASVSLITTVGGSLFSEQHP